jgi:hypothetical protein
MLLVCWSASLLVCWSPPFQKKGGDWKVEKKIFLPLLAIIALMIHTINSNQKQMETDVDNDLRQHDSR